MDEQKVSTVADKYIFQTYGRANAITLIRGEGCRLWDDNCREYLDFVSGLAVCSLGHSSPLVTKVLEDQSKKLVHVSNLYYTKPQADLARILIENSFADKVFFCNSGAEANEAAIKLVRRYSNEKSDNKKNTIISMNNSFHGRTMATLSATGQEKVRTGFSPLVQGFKFVDFNNLEMLEQAIDDTVCAVMLEPIQGEGGVVCPDKYYLKGVRKICDDNDLTLIFDEVQVGTGRTGKLFAYENFGVTPDIMTIAKALGNGLPIGAMLSTDNIASAFCPGTHATTFGGTPLVSAVAAAVVTSMLEDGILKNCREIGEYFRAGLNELKDRYSCIKEVKGYGLIIGMELDQPGAPVVTECQERGFLINCAQEKILRFIPPLIIGKNEIDSLLETLNDILGRM